MVQVVQCEGVDFVFQERESIVDMLPCSACDRMWVMVIQDKVLKCW